MDANDPAIPGPSKQVEDPNVTKKTRRKRGKTKYTHFKLGSSGGRPRRTNDLSPENVATGLEGNGSPMSQSALHELPESPHTTAESRNTTAKSPHTTVGSSEIAIESTRIASQSAKISQHPGIISPDEVMPNIVDEQHVSDADSPPAFGGIHASSPPMTQASPSASHSPTPVNFTADIASNSDAEEYMAPTVELVNDVISKLQRKVHLPWIIIRKDDGFRVMLLSRRKIRAVQRRAFFAFDGSEEISVHQKTPSPAMVSYVLEKENSDKICLTVGCEDRFVDRIVTVVRKFKSCEVCVGVV